MASKYQRVDKAFDFLQKKLRDSKSFTPAELSKVTSWKDAKAAIAKKLSLIVTKNKQSYFVKKSLNELSREEFRDLCSQKNENAEKVTRKLKLLNKTITDKFLDKAIAACISAIEIYNKPNFDYRNENFAILAVNAWELLLKAKILSESDNDIHSIYCKDNKGKIKYKKKSNIPLTKSISECIKAINDIKCEKNLDSLIQIRDSSIHFINEYPRLSTELHKVSLSCLANFQIAINKWFNKKFDEYNITVLPLNFNTVIEPTFIDLDDLTGNLIAYIEKNESESKNVTDSQYSYALTLKYEPKQADLAFQLSSEKDTQKLEMQPKDMQKFYKWTYKTLIEKFKDRYSNFIQNKKFHQLKNKILDDKKYCYHSKLDYKNPKSPKKTFYCPDTVIEFFDQHYILKSDNC